LLESTFNKENFVLKNEEISFVGEVSEENKHEVSVVSEDEINKYREYEKILREIDGDINLRMRVGIKGLNALVLMQLIHELRSKGYDEASSKTIAIEALDYASRKGWKDL
jgi:hypothetical protein